MNPRGFITLLMKFMLMAFFDAHIEPQLFYITDLDGSIVADRKYKIDKTNEMLLEIFNVQKPRHENKNPDSIKQEYFHFLKNNKDCLDKVLQMYKEDIKFLKELK